MEVPNLFPRALVARTSYAKVRRFCWNLFTYHYFADFATPVTFGILYVAKYRTLADIYMGNKFIWKRIVFSASQFEFVYYAVSHIRRFED